MDRFVEKELTAIVTKEGKFFVAFNPDTGVASQGKTKKSALKNLKEAVELFFEDDPVGFPEKRELVEFKAKVKIHA